MTKVADNTISNERYTPPIVSVVIPAYNAEKYIRESIDSVLTQTFKNYEIIVVDDGSTDSTGIIIQQSYPSVRYIFQKNGGPAKARNVGIKEARGEYIAFLDADDVWMPTKLEKQIHYFNQHPEISFVFTENSMFDEKGIIRHTLGKRERLLKKDVVRNIFMSSYLATPTVMVQKKVFEEVGYFEENLIAAEDDNMWMRIAMKFKVALIDEPLTMVRITRSSLTYDFTNIIKGVISHLELLSKKYPDIESRLGHLINKKYSILFLSAGYDCFSRNEFRIAREEFKKSFKYWKFNIRAILYIGATYLPIGTITLIREIRKRMAKGSESW
jgi:glycosyltransferase involved in cell wall biosynthesis